MTKIGKLLTTIILFLSSTAWSSLDLKVEAQADRTQMALGESVTINVRALGNEDFELDGQPRIKPPAGLELINAYAGGRQSSSSMSIINGQAQYTKSVIQNFVYQFSPTKEGTLVLPEIELTVNGQIFRSNQIKIEVSEKFRGGLQRPRPSQNLPGRPQFPSPFDEEEIPEEEDLFGQLLRQRQKLFDQLTKPPVGGFGQPQEIPSRQLDINPNESFFVWLDVDKKEAYEGEQVTANWYIYTKGNLDSLDRVKFPDLKGFWKEIIEEVPSLQFTREMVNGVMYNKALLASHALFPIKSGTAVIDEFRVKGRTRTLTQMGWGQPFESTKVSKKVQIKVLPLPTEGRTPQFSGAVGSYRVQLKTDETQYPAHQPFSVKVRFEGLGNAKLIELPLIQWPEGIEVYDTKSDSKFFKDGQSYKEFEILVIPRKEGPVQIPSMNFTYFDPAQKKYVNQVTDPLDLTILPGQAQAGHQSPIKAKDESKETFTPAPILQWPESTANWVAVRWPLYLISIVVIIVISLMSLIKELKQLKVEKSFSEIVQNRIQQIEGLKDHKKLSASVMNLIYLLGAQLAGSQKADQEWSMLTSEMPLQLQKKYLDRLNQLFDYFQLLGFSPDDIRQQLLQQKPLGGQLLELKKIAKEIADESHD